MKVPHSVLSASVTKSSEEKIKSGIRKSSGLTSMQLKQIGYGQNERYDIFSLARQLICERIHLENWKI